MEKIKLVDLVDVSILQKLQNAFSEYTGMAAVILDEEGNQLTEDSNFAHICKNLMMPSDEWRNKCKRCSLNGAVRCMETGRASVYECHAGLVDFSVPVMMGGKMVGCFAGGQVSPGEKTDGEIREIAKKLGFDEEMFLEEIKKVRVASREEVAGAAIYLRKLAEALSDFAYQGYQVLQVSRIAEETAKKRTIYMEGLFTDIARDITEWEKEIEVALNEGPTAQERLLLKMQAREKDILTFIRNTLVTIRKKNMSLMLREQTYQVKELMNELTDFLQLYYLPKGNTLSVRIGEQVPEALYGDKERIYRVLAAFLCEAGRNTEHGEVTVTIEMRKKEYAAVLEVEIKDKNTRCRAEGYREIEKYLRDYPDIKEEALAFGDVSREEGLRLADTLLGQLFGEIEVTGEPGSGSTYRLRFPQIQMKSAEE